HPLALPPMDPGTCPSGEISLGGFGDHEGRRGVLDARPPIDTELRERRCDDGVARHERLFPTLGAGGCCMEEKMKLVWPSREYLPSYVAALERGWSPDNVRGAAAARDELARIAADANAFLASLVDKEAMGDPVTLPDGTKVPRLPGYRRWMWDREFCGSIGFRWQRGSEALP